MRGKAASLTMGAMLAAGLPRCGEAISLTGSGDDAIVGFATYQYTYDSNLYRVPAGLSVASILSPGASRADHINSFTAGLDGHLLLSRQSLDLYAQLDRNQFATNDQLTNTSGAARLKWDWVASPWLQGNVGAEYKRSLGGFADALFFGRDQVNIRNYFGNARLQFAAHWKLNAGISQNSVDHSLDYRRYDDFRSRAANGGIEYVTGENNAIGFDYRFTRNTFPAADLAPAGTSVLGYRENTARVYARYEISGKTLLDLSTGYLRRQYPDNSAGNFGGNIWRGTVHYLVSGKTALVVSAWHDLTAYFDSKSDYFVSRGESVGPTWNPTERISLSLSAIWNEQKYVGSSRSDRIQSQQISLTYVPRDAWSLQTVFRHEYRDSNLYQYGYNDKIASASVNFSF